MDTSLRLDQMVTNEPILTADRIVDQKYTYHFSIAQNTPEWDDIRKGKITASPAKCLLVSAELKSGKAAAGSVGRLAKGAVTYAAKIAKDRYSPNAVTNDFSYYSQDMERGHQTEDAAAALFTERTGIATHQVGFVSRHIKQTGTSVGCSPDRIIIDQQSTKIVSGLELKSANSDIHFARLMDPQLLVAEHMAQVQFQMFCSGAKTWYLTSYNASFDNPLDRLIICKIHRDQNTMQIFMDQTIEMESHICEVLFDVNHLKKNELVW